MQRTPNKWYAGSRTQFGDLAQGLSKLAVSCCLVSTSTTTRTAVCGHELRLKNCAGEHTVFRGMESFGGMLHDTSYVETSYMSWSLGAPCRRDILMMSPKSKQRCRMLDISEYSALLGLICCLGHCLSFCMWALPGLVRCSVGTLLLWVLWAKTTAKDARRTRIFNRPKHPCDDCGDLRF